LDKENGTSLWYDAIQKEMKNIKSALHFLPDSESVHIGYKHIPCQEDIRLIPQVPWHTQVLSQSIHIAFLLPH
jgi:hypothetical protein